MLVSTERYLCLQIKSTKIWSLVTNGLVDVDGFKICIQDGMLLYF